MTVHAYSQQELLSELALEARRQSWLGVNGSGCFAYEWALDGGQKLWRSSFLQSSPLSSSVWLMGRQRGKTFAAIYIAIETGVTQEGSIIRYCAKTKDSAVSIVSPAWNFLVSTLPDHVRPIKGRNEFEFIFPTTGSTFYLFGTDAQSFSRGRGPKTTIQFFDECAFYQELNSIESALLPSLQTTGGKALYLSSPPESLAHPFVKRVYAARASNRFFHSTVYENPRVNPEAIIREEASRLGLSPEELVKTTYFRREYMAELVSETTTAGFPSFTIEKSRDIVKEFQPPQFFDGYISLDLGVTSDPHAALICAHDWKNNKLLVLDELERPSATTTVKVFSEQLKDLEKKWFGTSLWDGTLLGARDWQREFGNLPPNIQSIISDNAPRQPFLRVVDNAQGAARDLTFDHGYACIPADKFDKALAVDNVNQLFVETKILIHPRCRGLIEQLLSAQWNQQRTKWIQAETHHFDLVDCLVYASRHTRWSRISELPKTSDPFMKRLEDQFKEQQRQAQIKQTTSNLSALKGVFR